MESDLINYCFILLEHLFNLSNENIFSLTVCLHLQNTAIKFKSSNSFISKTIFEFEIEEKKNRDFNWLILLT